MSRMRFLSALVVGVIVGAAASVFVLQARGAPIEPLERLPGGIAAGPTAEEITDVSAVVALRTGEAALCQVTYGPTAAYGRMQRMSMTGPMTDHRVLLPGLEPDTEYHFRLTAVDGRARVYQSADLTFRTKPAAQARPAGRNVAALAAGARVVGVSSNFGDGDNASAYGANHAIDGDPSTEWSSNGDGDKAWIEIELAQPYRIATIGFWTRTMGTSAQIEEFEVIADGKTRLGPFRISGTGQVFRFPVDVTARRLRFNVLRSSGGNTGAVEIEVLTAP